MKNCINCVQRKHIRWYVVQQFNKQYLSEIIRIYEYDYTCMWYTPSTSTSLILLIIVFNHIFCREWVRFWGFFFALYNIKLITLDDRVVTIYSYMHSAFILIKCEHTLNVHVPCVYHFKHPMYSDCDITQNPKTYLDLDMDLQSSFHKF